MPKVFGQTKKGKLYWHLRSLPDRQFHINDLKASFPSFKTLGKALNELVEQGHITAIGHGSGRWYQYKAK